jgi:hypothetical protein
MYTHAKLYFNMNVIYIKFIFLSANEIIKSLVFYQLATASLSELTLNNILYPININVTNTEWVLGESGQTYSLIPSEAGEEPKGSR